MIKRMNKKGQELTIGTLILIVLGVIILVLLVIGFSVGWENIFKKFNIFGGGTDIESVVQSCKIALSSNAKYSFCSDFKKISVDGKVEYINCQDDRVASSLDGSISCDGTPAEDYCKNNLKGTLPLLDDPVEGADVKSNLKVNSKYCIVLKTP